MKFSNKLILIKNVSFSQLTEFGARVPYEFFFKKIENETNDVKIPSTLFNTKVPIKTNYFSL